MCEKKIVASRFNFANLSKVSINSCLKYLQHRKQFRKFANSMPYNNVMHCCIGYFHVVLSMWFSMYGVADSAVFLSIYSCHLDNLYGLKNINQIQYQYYIYSAVGKFNYLSALFLFSENISLFKTKQKKK